MSWHYSRALVAAYSAEHSLDGELSAQLKLMPTVQAFLSPDRMKAFSRLSRFGMTFAPLTEQSGEELLTWFLAGFPARTSPQPAKGQESTENNLDSGGKWQGSFVKWDQNTCLWKTHQYSLLGGLTGFSETWPQWGIMQDGACWVQSTLVPHTSDTESGLWPTPVANDDNKSPEAHMAMKKRMKGGPRQKPTSLNVVVKGVQRGLWPTPTANPDAKNTGANRKIGPNSLTQAARLGSPLWPTPRARLVGKIAPERANDKFNNLESVMAREMFATPQERDFRSPKGNKQRWGNPDKTQNLNDQIGGSLNPTWEEWLMGWPLEWTALKPLGMDKFQQWRHSHGGC